MLYFIMISLAVLLIILLVIVGVYLYKENKASGKEIKSVFYVKPKDDN